MKKEGTKTQSRFFFCTVIMSFLISFIIGLSEGRGWNRL